MYPYPWRENYIKPIFKGGCFSYLSNYRGISLTGCLGNQICRILYNRLDKYLGRNRIICKEEIGFKKGCRTSDHILTLTDKALYILKRCLIP
jgi:hypothetical protein